MSAKGPYDPLAIDSLADSIARAALDCAPLPLAEFGEVGGAGVYILYYTGELEWYAPISAANGDGKFTLPIYIGKAIPRGGRKGGFGTQSSHSSKALRDRLGDHFASIEQASNLNSGDFYFRSLTISDIWIPLGESVLIDRFRPVWNLVIDGFGNKDPGNRRKEQYKSPWDVIHPGRKFADKLASHPKSSTEIVAELGTYLKSGLLPKGARRGPSDIS